MTTTLPLAKTPTAPSATTASCSLPALIDRARTRLAEARTSAEVLEARAVAQAAYHLSKLIKAANETNADCLLLIKRAEIRMVDELEAAQKRGEVARHGGDRRSKSKVQSSDIDPATLAELGLSRQRVEEWRELHNAGENAVEAAIQSAVDEGHAPTSAGNQRALMPVAAASIFDLGIRYPSHGYEPADLACIKGRMAAWSRWAERHPAIRPLR